MVTFAYPSFPLIWLPNLVTCENDGAALFLSLESVPAALPQGNEPMEWIRCMLVTLG